jgi:hypothetical protein
VLDSWLKSTRDEPWAGNIPNNMAMAVLQEAVRQLLLRGATILVAANPERPAQIVGWLCSEPGREAERIVHAIYCKRPFRRTKVASQLLEAVGLSPTDKFPFTYRTIMSRVFPNARYIPGIQRRHKV